MKSTHRTPLFCFLLTLLFLNPDPCRAAESHAAEQSVAPADSGLVATFLALPDPSIKDRREQADALATQARDTENGSVRRSAWQGATRADPSRTQYWLSLAETELMMGDLPEARGSLASARVTLEFTTGKPRREAIRDYSLAVAWWNYEMGNWEDGRDWGQKAVEYDAGLSGHLIAGLNDARFLETWSEIRERGKVFHPLKSGGNRRADLSWCYLMFVHFQRQPFFAEDLAWWLHRQTNYYEHDLTRWRDYGQYCEVNDAESMALTYYEKSIDSLPIKDGGWITRTEWRIPSTTGRIATMPFWVNPDDRYITGSLLAYSGYAHDRMSAAGNTAERMAWAERLEAAAWRAEERYPSRPWPILWRGEALAILGQLDEASTVIDRARSEFQRTRLSEPALDRVQGHILLLQGKFAESAPLIRNATTAFPDNPDCWVDLGMVELRSGNNPAAHEAFDRALALNPELPLALYHRGLLRWREGRRQEALADIERAAELAPENPEIVEALATLGEAANPEE